MGQLVTGLHHVTAISSGAQRNADFYGGVLGLRLVKRTVNFDAPGVHHLYYGDGQGAPGTIMTFFPYEGLAPGRKGKGQVTVTSFAIPDGSLEHWIERLDRFEVEYKEPQERLGGEIFLSLEDHDGLGLELVVAPGDDRPGNAQGPMPPEHSIRGFHGVTICVDTPERTAGLLTEWMDHAPVKEGSGRFRYSPGGRAGGFVDIAQGSSTLRGLGGSGTIHHVAFATPDDDGQLAVREKLLSAGMQVTPVMDRQYFRSIYFREPGGVLFEVATEPPGFAIDEPLDRLGHELRLPPWVEPQREKIVAELAPVELDLERFR
jgi:glyoxalase family protein